MKYMKYFLAVVINFLISTLISTFISFSFLGLNKAHSESLNLWPEKPSSAVEDQAHIFSQDFIAQMGLVLKKVQTDSGIQIQVLTVPTLGELPIEQFSIEVVEAWALGDKKTDKGLLLLVAPNQKKVRIEVGQGLEGDIPDVLAKRIIESIMLPSFRKGDYQGGVFLALVRLVEIAAPQSLTLFEQSKGLGASSNSRQKLGSQLWNMLPLWLKAIIIFLVFIFWVIGPKWLHLAGGGFHRGGGGFGGGRGGFGGGGGFSGGGGWSGGGGGFSGGGSSGSW